MLACIGAELRSGQARRVTGFLQAEERIPEFEVFVNVFDEGENASFHDAN